MSTIKDSSTHCVRDERFDFPVEGNISAICQNCRNDYHNEDGYCYDGNRINGCSKYSPVDND